MASRKEEKERLRAERLAREGAAAASERRRRILGYAVAGLLGLAAVAAIVFAIVSGGGDGGDGPAAGGGGGALPSGGTVPAVEQSDLDAAVEASGCKLEDPPNEGSDHVREPVRYKANPPTSGDHFEIPAEDGAYGEPPDVEPLVHSLEHGRIIIQFDPAVPDEVKANLKALFDEDPYHLIITPNTTGMPYEVAATAWDHSLGCPEMNDQVFDAIRAFREEYRDQGPEFVP